MRTIRRFTLLALGVSGLLALFAGTAQAGIEMQHCEPVLRR